MGCRLPQAEGDCTYLNIAVAWWSTDDSRRVMTPLVRYRPAIISSHRAGRTNIPMRLLDLDGFVRHYVDVYDKTDEEASDILPLTRIWWPA